MSDARPITNVTDFVCSHCWNSFGEHDAGVRRGQELVCPHCGTVLPAELRPDIVSAIVNAPSVRDDDDDELEMDAATVPYAPSAAAVVPVVHAPAPAGQAATAQVAALPTVDEALGSGWLPPDLRPVSAAATASTTQPTPVIAAVSAPPSDASNTAEDIDDALMAALREMAGDSPEADLGQQPGVAGAAVVVGDEPVDLDEPTPPEGSDLVAQPVDPDRQDWKLKAIGLTYNFHGLDALIGWASNKAGQVMQISVDGQTWKDFDSFFALYRGGQDGASAFAAAAGPGTPEAAQANAAAGVAASAAVNSRTGRHTATKLPALDLKDEKGTKAPSPKAESTVAPTRTSATAVAPASAPSKRTPVAAATPAAPSGGKGAKIAVVVVLVIVAVVGLLISQGILSLPK